MAIPELHFLVVDDLKPVRRIVIALLELLGHTSTFEAEDGCQALAILRARSTCSAPINFVITDWNMPGMDGLDLVAAMRASEGLRDMPVLMISSEIGEQNLLSAKTSGVDGFLSKFSLGVEMLGREIDNILATKRSGLCRCLP
jgi:two-component system chemotaxis response regulator CheY